MYNIAYFNKQIAEKNETSINAPVYVSVCACVASTFYIILHQIIMHTASSLLLPGHLIYEKYQQSTMQIPKLYLIPA